MQEAERSHPLLQPSERASKLLDDFDVPEPPNRAYLGLGRRMSYEAPYQSGGNVRSYLLENTVVNDSFRSDE